MIRKIRWFIGTVLILGFLLAIFFYPICFLRRCLLVLILSCSFCLYRVFRGPTPADRAVGIDILGILIVGFCAVLGVATRRMWYIDIGIAWALQSFIGTLALAKYLEGRTFDE